MKSVRLLIALAALLFMLATTTMHAAEPTKILLIGHKLDHPWGSHMYLHTLGMLAKCAEQTEGVETVVSDGWPQDPKLLEGVAAIVVYSSPGAEFLVGGPHREELDKLMKQGVGLMAIHWATAVRKEHLDQLGDRWISYLGGCWVSNVGLSTEDSRLKQLAKEHPVCRGWADFDLHDEFYLNPTIPEGTTPVLEVTAKGKPLVVAWARERDDGGRAFGTTLGHYYRNYQGEEFRQMIVNAMLWTAKVEIPEQGAPIALSEQALALPKKPQ
jgi:type 1 glutamine amidotransferase